MKESLKSSKVSEFFRGLKQHRREFASQKYRTKQVNASRVEKELPMLLENSTKDSTRTKKEMTSNMK